MNSRYKRVSRQRTCVICGKPDWCSYTPDGRISFCARICEGADRISRKGWGVFYHEKSLFGNSPILGPPNAPLGKIEPAPIEIRDFAYRKLIALSSATRYPEIIEGPKGLRPRQILNFNDFGRLPPTLIERRELAKILRALVNRKFPDYVRKHKRSLTGIPGFWVDKNGKYQIWLDKDYSFPLMLIPYRNAQGMIQACQIRLMKPNGNKVRSFWLSTPKESGGFSCGCPIHFVQPMTNCLVFRAIIVTEGALKAETLQLFYPEYHVIALSGIGSSHQEFIEAARDFPLILAFDNDFHDKPPVLRQLARLFGARFQDAMIRGYSPALSLFSWSLKFKGIDEALIQGETITELAFDQWLLNQNSQIKGEIKRVLCYN